jgi:ParB family chromosome partitioning protein
MTSNKTTKQTKEQAAAVIESARTPYAGGRAPGRVQRQVVQLPVKDVRPDPNQPRKRFDDDEIAALATSIVRTGQITPITVRKEFDEERVETVYWIVAGERRWRAISSLGEAADGAARTIDALVLDHAFPDVVALVDNVCRRDLDVLEESGSLRRLHLDHGYSIGDLVEFSGRDKSVVSRMLRVAEIDQALLDQIMAADSRGARGFVLELVDAPASDRAAIVASAIAEGDLSRAFIRRWRRPPAAAPEAELASGDSLPGSVQDAAADAVGEFDRGLYEAGVPGGGSPLNDSDDVASLIDAPAGHGQSLADAPTEVDEGDDDEAIPGTTQTATNSVRDVVAGGSREEAFIADLEALVARSKPHQMTLQDKAATQSLNRIVDVLAKLVERSLKHLPAA